MTHTSGSVSSPVVATLSQIADALCVTDLKVIDPPRWVRAIKPDDVSIVYGPLSGRPLIREHFSPEFSWRVGDRRFAYVPRMVQHQGKEDHIAMMADLMQAIKRTTPPTPTAPQE